MGHDYHGIVNNEARRLCEESIDRNRIPDANEMLEKRRTQLSVDFSGTALDSVMQIEAGKLQRNIQREIENLYQEFIDDIEIWRERARMEIAVNKRTFSSVEGRMIDHYGAIYRPVDKRENYIKRCIGIPGDTISMVDAQVYVNGKEAPIFEFQNLQYLVENLTRSEERRVGKEYRLKISL